MRKYFSLLLISVVVIAGCVSTSTDGKTTSTTPSGATTTIAVTLTSETTTTMKGLTKEEALNFALSNNEFKTECEKAKEIGKVYGTETSPGVWKGFFAQARASERGAVLSYLVLCGIEVPGYCYYNSVRVDIGGIVSGNGKDAGATTCENIFGSPLRS